jgi:hypothetical protein
MRTLGRIAAAVGKGLVAGAVGTAAMTVSSTVEMRLRGREPSAAPARAAGKLLGVQPRNAEGRKRFSTVVHWGYGTAWGAPRGLLAAAGLPWPAATAAHLGLVWGTEAVMLPRLDVAPPVTELGPAEVAIDVWHHVVYAVVAGLAYAALDRE